MARKNKLSTEDILRNKLVQLCEAVLLFYEEGAWDNKRKQKWYDLCNEGKPIKASAAVLCDLARKSLSEI